jgi:hypothetical protein
MTPTDALKYIKTLVDETAALKDDKLRKVVLRSVIVVAQRGLGIAPDGLAERAPNVLHFPGT